MTRLTPIGGRRALFGSALALFTALSSVPAAPRPGSGLICEETDDAIEVRSGEQLLVRYNKGVQEAPEGIEAHYRRSGYIHPINSPTGRTVTGDFPVDHPHQHALFFAWTKAEFDGHPIDFWNQAKQSGNIRYHRTLETKTREDSVYFATEQIHEDITDPQNPVPVLIEEWQVLVRPPVDGYYHIDITSVMRCAGDKPLVLPKYHYGGFAFRGPYEWLPVEKKGEPRAAFLTSEGLGRIEGNHTRPNWVDLTGRVDKTLAGVAILNYPMNFRSPQPVRLHPEKPYFVFSPAVEGDFEISPGKEYRSRYRLVVHDGEMPAEKLNFMWNAYANQALEFSRTNTDTNTTKDSGTVRVAAAAADSTSNAQAAADPDRATKKTWYRGNTHTHSLWSDGNDFPEMIVDWYQEQGYDFIALSDHNVLAEGERWMRADDIKKRQRALGKGALEKYLERFGEDWVEERKDKDGATEIRLKTLEEYRPLFEKPDEFLVVQAEEISASYQPPEGKALPIHINAVNLNEVIPPIKGDSSVVEIMRANFQAIEAQEKASGRPILAHLNHPNFQWAITAEQLAAVVEGKFFEVYNGHPGINHLGDETRPGDEAIWDIANTIRIAELDAEPLFGVATDDSHTYHGGDVSPGRGWVMVHAERLQPDALIQAMRRGDFYASTGVYLEDISYDPASRKISLTIRPDDDATFRSELIGTRKGYDATAGETGIGEVLEAVEGTSVVFTVPEDALYARVTVTASRPAVNPSFEGQMKQAWTQPVGWRP